MEEKKVKFPIESEIKVIITNGESFGVVTIGMGFGSCPTEKEIQERISTLEKEEISKLPGYRLCTAPELWHYACMERTGQRFAVPANYQEFSPVE